MGGAGPAKRELSWPTGVRPRKLVTGTRIQIAFSFRGTECRELVPPGPVTQTAITLASGLRAEILRKIDLGSFHYADYFPNSPRAMQFDVSGKRILLADKLQDQLKVYEAQMANGQLSPSTLKGYKKAINSERMTTFADGKTLPQVTPSVLRDFIGGLGVTAKFARNLLTPLRSVFEDALNDELIEFDPFERIALKKLLKQTSKASEYEVDPFNQDERARLLEVARPDERAMLQFWFNTGLRPGELMALQWPKIDFVGRTARIDENLVEKVVKGPKTDAGIREVELNDDAIAALMGQNPITGQALQHVWHNPRTASPWEADAQIRKTLWQPLCTRAGIRYRNPYQVRHTYASELLTRGENPWYVAQQLGHVDVLMVFKIYGKFIRQDYQRPKAQAKTLRAVND